MDCARVMWPLVTSLLVLLQSYQLSEGIPCGFPGTPAYGYVKPDLDLYKEDAAVTYSCRVGYILLGAPVRRCMKDGSWTADIPICDDSMTTLGIAFSTPTVPGYPAEMAIDRDKESCTYLKPKKPRWWRIDLGGVHKVLSVAVTMISTDKHVKFTVFVIKIQGTSASYFRCASFSGKFYSPTIVLSCAEGKGIEGQRVHLEDHRQMDGLFEVCEVEVQVEKDIGYDCGRPDRQPNSITYDPEDDEVYYDCMTGYELVGDTRRLCEFNGQWSGEAPDCKPIVCDTLDPLENGDLHLTMVNGNGLLLEGSTVAHSCDEGYKLEGDFTRLCLRNGSWSGKPPKCEVIRCPAADGKEVGGVYRLLNKTTVMGNMAELKCRRGVKMEGDYPYIICTEDGKWTEPKASCVLPPGASRSRDSRFQKSKPEPVIKNHAGVIFGMAVAILMVLIIAIAFFIVKRRREVSKPALPSRHYELVPPPRPPPRTKGLKSTIIDLLGKDSANENCDWKTRSLPLTSAPKDDGYEEVGAARRTLSYDDTSKLKLHEKGEDAATGQATSEPPVEEKGSEEEQEEITEEKEEVAPATTPTEKSNGAYAAVDYDKKRQSRLLKDQDSQERSRPTSPAGNIQLRELPPIPSENEVRLTPPSSPIKNDEKKDEDEESEESEDVSLPIQPSDSQTSGAPTPSPDVVVDVQVDGLPGRSSTSTPEERPTRRTRGRVAEERPVESPPRRTRARATEQQRPEEPAESPTSRPTEDERPARRTRTRGGDQTSREEQAEDSTPDASTTSPSEERPTRRTRPTTTDRPDFGRSALQPTYRRRF